MKDRSLTREELRSVIDGTGCAYRIPIAVQAWISPNVFDERKEAVEQLLEQYPCDIVTIPLKLPQVFHAPEDAPSYRWMNIDNPFPPNVALDAVSAIQDWDALDEILADFPDPNYVDLIPPSPQEDGRYRVCLWWYLLFERFWSLRGMENALCDFYEYPEKVHQLFRALTDFYKVVLTRCRNELQADAIWTSDDIGTQNSPFFSLGIFQEFFKPYYAELIAHCHKLGMHFWLHSCGNIEPFIPELIEIGLDVLHPIQKYTMSEQEIARKYGDQICFWAGFDVQQIIPYGTPEQVRQEVRFMLDTYARPDGRLILAAGNNMTPDTPFDSLEALFDETFNYGIAKNKKWSAKE